MQKMIDLDDQCASEASQTPTPQLSTSTFMGRLPRNLVIRGFSTWGTHLWCPFLCPTSKSASEASQFPHLWADDHET